MACDCFVEQCGVQDGAGDGAYLVEGGRHGDDAVTGDGAVGGLDADATGQCCGLADGAAGVGAERQGCLEGSDGCCGAAAGAAGCAVECPGVADYAECGVLVGGAHCEFVEVGLAEDGHACFADLAGDGTVVGAHPAFEHARCCGGGLALGDDEVLDGDGYACERGQFLACCAVCVHCCCGGECFFGVDVQEGVEAALTVCSVVAQGCAVGGCDAVQVCLGELDGGDFAGCELFCCFCGGELDQFVHLVVLLLVFVEDCRHAELAVLCVGGAGERLFLGEGGDGHVFTEDVLEGDGVAGRGDVGSCFLRHGLNGCDDDVQLRRHRGEFFIGHLNECQRCQVLYLFKGDGRHGSPVVCFLVSSLV